MLGVVRRRIGYKIIMAVGASVALGLVVMIWFYTAQQERSILAQHERSMASVAESVIRGLETVMLAGYADIAETFAEQLKSVSGVTDFRILKVDGTEAFLDNETVDAVIEHRGRGDITRHETERVVPVLAATHGGLRETLETKRLTYFYETLSSGEETLTYLAPILNGSSCQRCHGSDHEIRGVLKLTTTLEPAQADIRRAWSQALVVLLVSLVSVMALTGYMIHRAVVRPIEQVTGAMLRASKGELDQRVPVFGQDELSVMASSFNRMTGELLDTYAGLHVERNKLTTIILSAGEGIVVTDADGSIVLVNPAAEALLGKTTERILSDGFRNLFDSPEVMDRLLDRSPEDEATVLETLSFNQRWLSVAAATIRSPDGGTIGSSALIRDVTEEKRLEEELRELSNTDGLTGLFNRRYLDAALADEVTRVRRYGTDVSVIMVDVDEFKRFNDTYGHELGDRVLEELAAEIRETVRSVDIPCRYGGEEFLVILPSTRVDDARTIAERLRSTVEATSVEGLRVTISAGVAGFQDGQVDEPDALVEAADRALYAAKEAGRNRVEVATVTPA